jgi:TRAP-type C4-dicarboxylate transport system substrate-binding protein
MIEAVSLTPFFALASQCDRAAPNMLAMDWAPFVGAVVIRKSAWDKFPAASLERTRQVALEAGVKLRTANRKECDDAVVAMQKRRLNVTALTPAAEAEWRRLAEGIYPKIRGNMVPEDVFDQVQRLLNELRKQDKGGIR